MFKKFLSSIVAGTILVSITPAFSFKVTADSDYKLGLTEENSSYMKEHCTIVPMGVDTIIPYRGLASSVDLSESIYFPEIGDQGLLGACTSFATTYYQFSYEVNRLNNITNISEQVTYSPKWTYNLANNGINGGTNWGNNYSILETFGALKNSDFEYTGNPNDYTYLPPMNVEEKIEALKFRLSNINEIHVPVDANISSPNSSVLNNIKLQLNSGKVLAAATDCVFNSKVVDGKCIAYRCTSSSNGGHAVAIVGYDDNKWVDINGDGVKQTAEKGALKVANSWGKNFSSHGISSNDGFFWVAYDSLNYKSQVSGNWESSLTGTRCPTFSEYNVNIGAQPYNVFFSIDVEEKSPNLIGGLYVNTKNREALNLNYKRIFKDNDTSWSNNGAIDLATFDGLDGSNSHISFNGYIIFDYSNLADTVAHFHKNYIWQLEISDYSDISSARFYLFDDKSNFVTGPSYFSCNSGNSYYTSCPLNLSLGDVNYTGNVTAADADIVLEYVAGKRDFSKIQYFLADITKDGFVDLTDAVALAQLTA